MRVVNINRNDISDYDLNKGRLIECNLIKTNSIFPDGKTKIAYSDDDYEKALMYIPITIEQRIAYAKGNLISTDYISAKMADKLTSCASSEEVDEVLASFNTEYAEVLKQRQEWRDEINELEAELASVANE